MAFELKNPSLDLGETPLENIFINNFMNMANEVQLKVYILGLSMTRSGGEYQSNFDIATILGLEPEQVKEAWIFWKNHSLVDFDLPEEEDDLDFNVKFLSVRELYINSNYRLKSDSVGEEYGHSTNQILYNEDMKEFFEKAEQSIKKPLSPDDRIQVIDWMRDYKASKPMLLRALEITFVENPPEKPSLKYAKGILAKWSSNNVSSLEEANEFNRRYLKQAEFYREVNYRLASKTSLPTEAQIKIIEDLKSRVEDKESFMKLVDFCSTRFTHATFDRLRTLVNRIEKEDSLTSSGIDSYIQRTEQDLYLKGEGGKVKASKSKQNFKQNTYLNMSREDGIVAMRKNNPALLYNPKKER